MNAISWVERIDQIIFDAEVATTDYFSSYTADDYLRMEQKTGSHYQVGIYDTDEKDLELLERKGNEMIETYKGQVQEKVRRMLDEKYSH